MSEAPRRFGVYEVEREVGRGGMGVVYKARDPRLDRAVAIKVLPPEVAQDPERLARFEREARLLASLNHPNIGGIYGIEEADGVKFLVLEYLDGPTLTDRLRGGALPVEEATAICRGIAAALEAAHENGIVHRDLKPSNVKLVGDDGVKVLDFGLAKGAGTAESISDLSNSPTMTAHATDAGVILGTAAYMSPEQARGKVVDRRSDVWSFGCVLYECLTGRQLFAGETVSDTIAKILEREPDWSALPATTPEKVVELLRRCLEKDPRRRLRDIGDAWLHLDEIERQRTSDIRAAEESGKQQIVVRSSRRSAMIAWGVAAVFAVLAILQSDFFDAKSLPPRVRFEIQGPPGVDLSAFTQATAISPDGRYVVARGVDSLGNSQLYVREMNAPGLRPLPGTANGGYVFWSPDSRQLAFMDDSRLRRMPVHGSESESVCEATSSRGGSWGRDWIVFAGEQGPINRVSPSGGVPEAVTTLDESRGESAHRFPHFLPDGKTFLYVALPARSGRLDVYATDVDGRKPVHIMESVSIPAYAAPGWLVFQRGSRLLAQRFDTRGLKLKGEPVPLGRAPARPPPVGAPAVSASANGHMLYVTPQDWTAGLVWLDRGGRIMERLDVEPAEYTQGRISPDGRHMALVKVTSPEEVDIWVLELERLVLTRLTHGGGNKSEPVWSPDGRSIAFTTDRDGAYNIYRVPFPGGGEPEPVVTGPSPFKNAMDWSPDGKYLLYEHLGTGTNMDLWIAPVDGGELRPYIETTAHEASGRFSSDGRWVVYTSTETGQPEVYLNSFPEPGDKHRVSVDGGLWPDWGPGDREIEYARPGSPVIMRVSVSFDPVRIGTPRAIYAASTGSIGGDLSPDGMRFLEIRQIGEPKLTTLTVDLNWLSAFEKTGYAGGGGGL